MFRITPIEINETPFKWGEYVVHKKFTVENITNNRNNRQAGVNGFVVQVVDKRTNAYALCNDNKIRQINNIEEFTSDRVKYMNESYIELFPIIDGNCDYGDNFQNGAILTYYKDGRKFYTDDNPPTSGNIEQIGRIFFIPITDIAHITDVNANIDRKSRKKYDYITIFGLQWNISTLTPANGLPYIPYDEVILTGLYHLSQSRVLRHNVSASWNGLYPIRANTTRNGAINRLDNCSKINGNSNNVSSMRQSLADTILISTFTET